MQVENPLGVYSSNYSDFYNVNINNNLRPSVE